MTFKTEHEIHKRRLGRNIGVGLTLLAFVAVVFGLTVVKVQRGDPMQAYDHVIRPDLAAPVEAKP